MTMPDRATQLERLRSLVETHGGDRERWPAAERRDMAQLIATDAAAAAIVAEARALDRVLDKAPTLGPARLADLTQRIVAAAEVEGRWQGEAPQAAVVEASRDGQNDRVGMRARSRDVPSNRPWFAAMLEAPGRGPAASVAMLAASLVFGILIGLSATSSEIVATGQTVAEVGEDGVVQQLVMGEDSLDSVIEDLL